MSILKTTKIKWLLCSRTGLRLFLPATAILGMFAIPSLADILQTTVQPVLGVNYMICIQGNDPSTSANQAFVGEIAPFAENISESGWIPCDGSSLSTTTDNALFNVIGTTYGGNGSTTFNIPDLNGSVAIGAGQGGGLTDRTLGDNVGSNLVSLNGANLPVANGGQGQSFSNMQSSVPVNYIINIGGIFPARSVATPLIAAVPSGPSLPTSSTTSLLSTIAMFAGSVAPPGWAFCDGSLLPTNTDSALFALLGTDFGGNGLTTFALPDLRGRAPIGTGTGPGLSPQVIGERNGQESTTLQTLNIPPPGGFEEVYENVQPTLGVNYIISLFGTFPTQNPTMAAPDVSLFSPDVAGTGDPEVGQISMIAANFAPEGWALCEGQTLPIDQFQALFELLGITYGGNGINTFALPDLRGRVLAGADATDFSLGELTGTEFVTLTNGEVANLPEPSSIAILALGAIFLRRRKRPIA